MFTGIIQSVGHVVTREKTGDDFRFIIASNFDKMSDVALGDSIAMDGVCLTVTQIDGDKIVADVSVETMSKTNVGGWKAGTRLNLEKSLTLNDKLGGHMVSGHIDAMARCTEVFESGRSFVYRFEIPKHLDKYIVTKGSIGINGVSLTVNTIEDYILSVNLIPHTLAHTNLGDLSVGDQVNIEIDTIARYVEKMTRVQQAEDTNEY
jgi:riboflavin synthase